MVIIVNIVALGDTTFDPLTCFIVFEKTKFREVRLQTIQAVGKKCNLKNRFASTRVFCVQQHEVVLPFGTKFQLLY